MAWVGPSLWRRCVSFLSTRNLIGSDAAIVLTCFQHFYQAGSFLLTGNANGAIGMAALLKLFHWPLLASAFLIVGVILAVLAEWGRGFSRDARFWMLLPQFCVLVVEALWALNFVAASHYADGVPRPWNFIFCDQMPRIGMPIWYGAALLARIRE